MNITNVHALPETFRNAVRFLENVRQPIDSKRNAISVTRLIDSPRIVQLQKRYGEQLTADVTDQLWALLGSALHQVLAWNTDNEDVLTEQRMSVDINGWNVSGQFDRFDTAIGLLSDYKVTSVYGVLNGVKPEWEKQLNVLRYLLALNRYRVDRLEIIAVLRDWQSAQALRDPSYPAIPVVRIEVPVWDLVDTEDYIVSRVKLHQQAETEQTLPECTPAERWEKDATYAVVKPGRSRALRVFTTREEAETLVEATPGSALQVRSGESIRCERFCPCAAFCDQFQASQKTAQQSIAA
ncbi:hypothetical protein [Thiocapsa marina]|uniref:PD-(D/E)XK endonuclease-like domain-containing protein n=1 Tax=Thiocapsa marina 5811 TaxID=768671 RepID=F9UH30_9GAMM|nr:hypothetical protein [Thiocapsa marina]EGV16434.1 hypothetical protein ThimaDRAFT_4203 [Thiocapsa marina 5811]